MRPNCSSGSEFPRVHRIALVRAMIEFADDPPSRSSLHHGEGTSFAAPAKPSFTSMFSFSASRATSANVRLVELACRRRSAWAGRGPQIRRRSWPDGVTPLPRDVGVRRERRQRAQPVQRQRIETRVLSPSPAAEPALKNGDCGAVAPAAAGLAKRFANAKPAAFPAVLTRRCAIAVGMKRPRCRATSRPDRSLMPPGAVGTISVIVRPR